MKVLKELYSNLYIFNNQDIVFKLKDYNYILNNNLSENINIKQDADSKVLFTINDIFKQIINNIINILLSNNLIIDNLLSASDKIQDEFNISETNFIKIIYNLI